MCSFKSSENIQKKEVGPLTLVTIIIKVGRLPNPGVAVHWGLVGMSYANPRNSGYNT